jgi:hypothetical protein
MVRRLQEEVERRICLPTGEGSDRSEKEIGGG